MDKAEQRQDKSRRTEESWMKVIANWLHHYPRWKNRLDRLKERSEQEPKVTARITGMPSGSGTTGNSTLDTAQARMEATEQLYDLREKVQIIEFGLKAMLEEQRRLVDLMYFRGIRRDKDPWEEFGVGKTTFFAIRKEAFQTIYYIGWEEIDDDVRKLERIPNESRTNNGQQVAKAVLQ